MTINRDLIIGSERRFSKHGTTSALTAKFVPRKRLITSSRFPKVERIARELNKDALYWSKHVGTGVEMESLTVRAPQSVANRLRDMANKHQVSLGDMLEILMDEYES